MRPNIGILNAIIRITCGFTMLSWATAKLVKRPYMQSYLTISMLGAMKVAEGITRYCPVTEIVQRFTKCESERCEDLDDQMINPS